MLHIFRRHAIPIRAHLEFALVLAWALPAPALAPYLVPGLTLDTFGGFAFLAIAVVKTRHPRPAFLPANLGLDFYLSGYRVFTRYRTAAARELRGLRILRSDTNSLPMALGGNLLTRYNYGHSRWRVRRTVRAYEIEVATPDGRADLHVTADLLTPAALPPGSPFRDFREARRFAGPLPFTFDYEPETDSVLRVEGVRQSWNPHPVNVEVNRAAFLEQAPLRAACPVLANAFLLENVPYSWLPGICERLP
jgi:hypothetical protein